MKKVILFLWQLPQNLLALALMTLLRLKHGEGGREVIRGITYVYYPAWNNGVSLGGYVLLGGPHIGNSLTVMHEYGHTRQSLMLGPLYLIMIGIPSGLGNLWDRWTHGRWPWRKAYKWYYSQPWERWADRLGGVRRDYE